eukprot:TRINITY_DN7292_c1_g1_i2.p1 TRINITY_DN7292_c1_g1~~TRINITY_DN7292_c1_g1_i2.p1  ORF type:complete len:859 (+),score=179.50 TRINITY_DN7292_c1_g1_i2:47-2623(+)
MTVFSFAHLTTDASLHILRQCRTLSVAARRCGDLEGSLRVAIDQHTARRQIFPGATLTHSLLQHVRLPRFVSGAHVVPILYTHALAEKILRDLTERVVADILRLTESHASKGVVDFHFAIAAQLGPKIDQSGFAEEFFVLVGIAWRTPELFSLLMAQQVYPPLSYETLESRLTVDLPWQRIKNGSGAGFHDGFSSLLRAHERPGTEQLQIPDGFANYELILLNFPPDADPESVYSHVTCSSRQLVLHRSEAEYDVHLAAAVTLIEEQYDESNSTLILRVAVARLWRSEAQYRSIQKDIVSDESVKEIHNRFPAEQMPHSGLVTWLKMKDMYIEELQNQLKDAKSLQYSLEQTLQVESERADLLELRLLQMEGLDHTFEARLGHSSGPSDSTFSAKLQVEAAMSSLSTAGNITTASESTPRPRSMSRSGFRVRRASIYTMQTISEFFDGRESQDAAKGGQMPETKELDLKAIATSVQDPKALINEIESLQQSLEKERTRCQSLMQENESITLQLIKLKDQLRTTLKELDAIKKLNAVMGPLPFVSSGEPLGESSLPLTEVSSFQEVVDYESKTVLSQLKNLAKEYDLPLDGHAFVIGLRKRLEKLANPGSTPKGKVIVQTLQHEVRRTETVLQDLWALCQHSLTSSSQQDETPKRMEALKTALQVSNQRIAAGLEKLKETLDVLLASSRVVEFQSFASSSVLNSSGTIENLNELTRTLTHSIAEDPKQDLKVTEVAHNQLPSTTDDEEPLMPLSTSQQRKASLGSVQSSLLERRRKSHVAWSSSPQFTVASRRSSKAESIEGDMQMASDRRTSVTSVGSVGSVASLGSIGSVSSNRPPSALRSIKLVKTKSMAILPSSK